MLVELVGHARGETRSLFRTVDWRKRALIDHIWFIWTFDIAYIEILKFDIVPFEILILTLGIFLNFDIDIGILTL